LRGEFARIHDELRDNVLKNMVEQYDKTGFIWEHYNDVNGHGEGNHPFTGWSALVLAILAGNY
jgi:mannosyl-oligosaccharide glucosidase